MHSVTFRSLLCVGIVHDSFLHSVGQTIGVLYPSDWSTYSQIRTAVKIAAELADADASTSSISTPAPVRLLFNDTTGDRLIAARSLVWMGENGAEAVVGPGYSSESLVASPFATEFMLPLVSYSAEAPTLSQKSSYPFFFRTCPTLTLKLVVVAEICRFYGWRRLALVHVADAYGEALVNLMALESSQELELISLHALPAEGSAISSNRIQPSKAAKDAARAIQEKQVGVVVLALYAPGIQELMNAFMPQGMQLGMAYITLELDSDALQDSVTASYFEGAIAIRPVQRTTPLLDRFLARWATLEPATYPTTNEPLSEFALYAADAVFLLASALQNGAQNPVDKTTRRSVVQGTVAQGVSGRISFGTSQDRVANDFDFEIVNLQGSNFVRFARYNSANMSMKLESAAIFPGRTTVVPTDLRTPPKAIILVPTFQPFQSVESTSAGDRLSKSTYIAVLLERLAAKIRRTHAFEYEIVIWPHSSYTDMLHEVANNKSISMAAGDITITAARAQFVQFSQPFYSTHVSIVYRRDAEGYSPFKFVFLKPLDLEVWVAWAVAMVAAAHLVWLLELGSSHFPRSYFKSWRNIFWLAGTSVFHTCQFTPENGSTRILLQAMFLATLVLTTTYTASLTTALVNEGAGSKLGIDQLSAEKLGCTNGVAVCDYLLDRGFKIHQDLPPIEGVLAVMDERVDFYPMDTPMAIDLIKDKCDELKLLPDTLYDTLFGFAFRPGNGLKDLVDRALIELWDNRELEDLDNRYIPKDHCEIGDDELVGVSMRHMGDVFLLLGAIAFLCLAYTLCKWGKNGLPDDHKDHSREAAKKIEEAAEKIVCASGEIVGSRRTSLGSSDSNPHVGKDLHHSDKAKMDGGPDSYDSVTSSKQHTTVNC